MNWLGIYAYGVLFYTEQYGSYISGYRAGVSFVRFLCQSADAFFAGSVILALDTNCADLR